ncbi:prephenate dehydratase [Clostridium aestuarii]|uniref:Bifunctional chorismate mutase/prephenate dehydratase n=1 Tax=Clostridium aestuarii TaxID=338193 RepID=A0ABT4D195_9CLOT|nr:prephenate dehydratase [Clostridium aestuarii]MCY6485009.1 prephenate dehydratase [Clostridium aestuarii]
MNELEKLREEINQIDKQLTELFEKRMNTVLKVAQYKKENNIPILNKNREEQVINRNNSYLENKDFETATAEFFKDVMSISRRLQAKNLYEFNYEENNNSNLEYELYKKLYSLPKKDNVKVGFQGVNGSFSEQALQKYFGDKVSTYNVAEFEDVFKALQNSEIDYGILPIENSSTGGISEIYDFLRKYGFFIVGETCVEVNHNLLGVKGAKCEDIMEVYSHPQAFEQSKEFLHQYSQWKLIPHYNTAISAKYVKDKACKSMGAIGSKKAAELYDLEIIESDINYNTNNYTRFIIIGKNLEFQENHNKISITLSLPHKAGELYNILSVFAENNLSMLKIESRPILNKPWEYFFYIDFKGNLSEKGVKEAIKLINNNSHEFKLLGNYKAYLIEE